jgi:anti-sigma B factor antagonist
MSTPEPIAHHNGVHAVRENGTALVVLRGEVDLSLGQELRVALAEAMGADRVIVDLGAATFIDSTTINALLVARRAAQAAHVALVILPGPDNVMRTLQVSGVADLIAISGAPRRYDRSETEASRSRG